MMLLAALAFAFFPNSGSIAGGDTIQLTVQQAIVGTPEVSFDGIPATRVTVVDAHTIATVTPPHSEAAVIIRLRMNGESADSFAYFGYIREREELLIPIATETAGGYGTRWTTDIAVYNDSDESVSLTPNYTSSLGAFFPGTSDLVVPAHGVFKVPLRGTPEMYLVPPIDVRDKLHFNVRVRNAADPNDLGTEIPITENFRNERVVLPDVPVNSLFRSALRAYSIGSGESIVVRVFDEATGTLLLERESGPHFFPTDSATRFSYPFFDILNVAADRVRIEVEQKQGHVWAMLTLTDNATQRITVITSQ